MDGTSPTPSGHLAPQLFDGFFGGGIDLLGVGITDPLFEFSQHAEEYRPVREYREGAQRRYSRNNGVRSHELSHIVVYTTSDTAIQQEKNHRAQSSRAWEPV